MAERRDCVSSGRESPGPGLSRRPMARAAQAVGLNTPGDPGPEPLRGPLSRREGNTGRSSRRLRARPPSASPSGWSPPHSSAPTAGPPDSAGLPSAQGPPGSSRPPTPVKPRPEAQSVSPTCLSRGRASPGARAASPTAKQRPHPTGRTGSRGAVRQPPARGPGLRILKGQLTWSRRPSRLQQSPGLAAHGRPRGSADTVPPLPPTSRAEPTRLSGLGTTAAQLRPPSDRPRLREPPGKEPRGKALTGALCRTKPRDAPAPRTAPRLPPRRGPGPVGGAVFLLGAWRDTRSRGSAPDTAVWGPSKRLPWGAPRTPGTQGSESLPPCGEGLGRDRPPHPPAGRPGWPQPCPRGLNPDLRTEARR